MQELNIRVDPDTVDFSAGGPKNTDAPECAKFCFLFLFYFFSPRNHRVLCLEIIFNIFYQNFNGSIK
jgi:hypothetical protein